MVSVGTTTSTSAAYGSLCDDSDVSDPHFNRLAVVHRESLSALGGGGTGHMESGGTGTLAKVTLIFGIFIGVCERYYLFIIPFHFEGIGQCHSSESRAHHCKKNSQLVDCWTAEAAMPKTDWV